MPRPRDAVTLLVVFLVLTSVRVRPLEPRGESENSLVPAAEAATLGEFETAGWELARAALPAPAEVAIPVLTPTLPEELARTRRSIRSKTLQRFELGGTGIVIVIESGESETEAAQPPESRSSCPDERMAESRTARWTRC